MHLNSKATFLFKEGKTLNDISSEITHMAIGAHQDDLEIMALHAIGECYNSDKLNFCGVTCTNGAGSARTGAYSEFTDQQMIELRRLEQEQAAKIGDYSALYQLGLDSSTVKDPTSSELVDDLTTILKTLRPKVIYTHNPADKHGTHISIVTAVVKALRSLAHEYRPDIFLGAEVWRSLDWLPDSEKVLLNTTPYISLFERLIEVYRTQVAGGKRYDLATIGRMMSNATYSDSHCVDQCTHSWIAMDLLPLLKNTNTSILDYTIALQMKFIHEVKNNL